MKKNISIFGLLAAILLAFNVSSASADPTYAVLDTNGNVTNIIVCGSACASGEFGGNKVVLQVAADPVTGENRGGIWQGQGTTAYNENTGVFTVTQNPVLINSDVNNDIQNISSTTIINTDTVVTIAPDTIQTLMFTVDGVDVTATINKRGKETAVVTNTEERKNIKTTSSVNIVGEVPSISFKYEDTIGDNLFTRNRFIKNWADNSQATISVNVEQTITTATVANGVENILSTNTENNVESISFDSRKTAQEIQDFVTNSNLLLLNSKVQTLISLLGSWVK
jgi:hypothetical protein